MQLLCSSSFYSPLMLPTPPLSPKSASPPAAAPDQGDGVAALVGVSRAEPSRPGTLRRAMGDAEVAAYVVSRDGTGDLYAHANTSVPHTQACMAWALVLLRHPLLASCVVASHILYTRPESVCAALAAADGRLTVHNADLLDAQLNGRRVLASDSPSHLSVRGLPAENGAGVPTQRGCEILISVAGHVADATAVHRLLDEVLGLFSIPATQLQIMIQDEVARTRPLPPALENRFTLTSLQKAVGVTAALRAQVQSHTFPRTQAARVAVPTRTYSVEQSERVLHRCIERGVSLRAVVTALCAVAWARRTQDPRLPISIALNHDLEGSETCLASVAVPVVISSLAPGVSSLAADVAGLVWYRASALDRKLSRLSQLGREHKSCLHVARLRGATALAARRALCAARVEDARVAANNPGLGLGIVIPHRAAPVPLGVLDPDAPAPPAAPRCLLTLTVSEPTYSSDVDSVLVGARMPPGEVGVHAYVAGGKLTLSLAYDVNGAVEGWWADVLGLVSDVLLQ